MCGIFAILGRWISWKKCELFSRNKSKRCLCVAIIISDNKTFGVLLANCALQIKCDYPKNLAKVVTVD